jgi:hypothetical protein
MADTNEELVIETPAEELPAEEQAPAIPAEEEQPWRDLSDLKTQVSELTSEVRMCNRRAEDQAATVSQLLATNQELTRQLQENNQLLSTRAASSPDPEPEPPPQSETKPSETKSSESDAKPETKSEPEPPPVDPEPERQPRRRRSI